LKVSGTLVFQASGPILPLVPGNSVIGKGRFSLVFIGMLYLFQWIRGILKYLNFAVTGIGGVCGLGEKVWFAELFRPGNLLRFGWARLEEGWKMPWNWGPDAGKRRNKTNLGLSSFAALL
jgi:hypothetical protein